MDQPHLRDLLDPHHDLRPDPAYEAEMRRQIAYVSEGFCPKGHGQLSPGAHPMRYGWCHGCNQGYSATREVDPDAIDNATINMYFPVGGQGPGPTWVTSRHGPIQR